MRLEPLYDLQQEINRLYIAGSKFAAGDPRLLKQVPVYQKLGEKAPVFKKIAADIQDLANGDANDSAQKLMSLSTLLYSILYTQGETTLLGEIQQQVPEIELSEGLTKVSYAELKPVFKALTVSGSGRLEVVKEAHKNGIFRDLRTFSYLANIFEDKNHELVQYVIDKILPDSNGSLGALIYQGFEYKDTAPNVHRLKALIILEYQNIEEMVEHVFNEQLPKLQAQAFLFLQKDEKNEAFIVALTKDGNKLVREAAFNALAHRGTSKSLLALSEAYASIKAKTRSKLNLVINAIKRTKHLPAGEETIASLNQSLKDLIDAPTPDKMDSFSIEIRLLQNKPFQVVSSFMESVLEKYSLLVKTPGCEELTNAITTILDCNDSEQIIRVYEKFNLKEFSKDYFHHSVKAKKNPKVLFDLFHAYYNETIYTSDLLQLAEQKSSLEYDTTYLDARWKAIVETQTIKELSKKNSNRLDRQLWLNLIFLHQFEPKNSKSFDDLLFKYLESDFNEQIILLILERTSAEKYDRVFEVFESKASYISDALKLELMKFPKSYAPKFRGIAVKKTVYLQTHLTEIAEEIEKRN